MNAPDLAQCSEASPPESPPHRPPRLPLPPALSGPPPRHPHARPPPSSLRAPEQRVAPRCSSVVPSLLPRCSTLNGPQRRSRFPARICCESRRSGSDDSRGPPGPLRLGGDSRKRCDRLAVHELRLDGVPDRRSPSHARQAHADPASPARAHCFRPPVETRTTVRPQSRATPPAPLRADRTVASGPLGSLQYP